MAVRAASRAASRRSRPAAGLEPGLPAWRVLFEAARRRHGLWGEDMAPALALGGVAQPAPRAGRVVPLPAVARGSGATLLSHDEPGDELDSAGDPGRSPRRRSLYRGLAGLDEPTLAALAAEPGRSAPSARTAAEAFAAFGGRFRVRDGAVVLPGGPARRPRGRGSSGRARGCAGGVPAGARSRARGGRRAFLFDSLARLDDAHQRFALGLELPADRVASRSRRSPAVFDGEEAWWRHGGPGVRPPRRGCGAPAARGRGSRRRVRLARPASPPFWEAVFDPAGRRGDVRRRAPVRRRGRQRRVAGGADRPRRARDEVPCASSSCCSHSASSAKRPPAALGDAALAVAGVRRHARRWCSRSSGWAAATRRSSPRACGPRARAASRSLLRLPGRARDRASARAVARHARSRDGGAAGPVALRSCRAGSAGAARPCARRAGSSAQLLPAFLARPPSRWPTRAPRRARTQRPAAGQWCSGRSPATARAGAAGRRVGGPVVPRRPRARRSCQRRRGACASGRAAPGFGGARPRAGPRRPGATRCAEALGRGAGGSASTRSTSATPTGRRSPATTRRGATSSGLTRGRCPRRSRARSRLARRAARCSASSARWPPWRCAARPGRAAGAPPVAQPPRTRAPGRGCGIGRARTRSRIAGATRSPARSSAGRRRVGGLEAGTPEVEAAAATPASIRGARARSTGCCDDEPGARRAFFSLVELLLLGAPRRAARLGARLGCRGTRWRPGCGPRRPARWPLDDAAGRPPEPALAEGFVDLHLRVALHLRERRLPASLAPALVAARCSRAARRGAPARARTTGSRSTTGCGRCRDERLDDAVASLAGARAAAAGGASEGRGEPVARRSRSSLGGRGVAAGARAARLAAEDAGAAPSLAIDEPAPGQFVSGPVTLRARVEPAGRARSRRLTLHGGRRAGLHARGAAVGVRVGRGHRTSSARTMRAVAMLADGSRLVDSVRTQDAGLRALRPTWRWSRSPRR